MNLTHEGNKKTPLLLLQIKGDVLKCVFFVLNGEFDFSLFPDPFNRCGELDHRSIAAKNSHSDNHHCGYENDKYEC